jgi:hypothetical protein
MSGPVDVLAVLGAVLREPSVTSSRRVARRQSVFATQSAVAELIEAAENALAKAHSYNPVRPDATACMVRLRAAIARCKGGSNG